MKLKNFIENFNTRKSEIDTDLNYRTLSIRVTQDGPASLDDNTRSVGITLATEAPALVFDYQRFEVVPEVLIMSGCKIPKSRQVPMLNVHSKYDLSSVIGSVRELQVVNGELQGRAYFSEAESVREIWTKVREGHITDFSAGYAALKGGRRWIPEGETSVYEGKTFKGPMLLTTKWAIREGSAVPIGADEDAKARNSSTKQQMEVDEMDEKTKQFLISRGLDPNASDEEAYRFLAKLNIREEPDDNAKRKTPPVVSHADGGGGDDNAVDISKLRQDATKSERKRINEVLALGQRFECEGFVEPFLTDGTEIETVRMKVAEHVFKRAEELAPQNPHPATITVASEDKFRAAVEDSLIMRSSLYQDGNISLVGGERAAPGADELMGYSLREIARECLRVAGQPTGGHVLEMVGRALVTSDLPNLLANVANKSLFAGWDKAPETWQEWCGTDVATDFKTHDLPRVSEFSSLDQVPEQGEYQYGKITDAKEQFQLGTYGKLFAISRQAIINDDIGVVTKIPALHGEAAARKVGDVAYAVLTANGTMGDGNALFDATNHANYVASGSGGAPGITTIAAAIKAMKLQKGLQSLQYLNIRPEFFIAPATLEGVSEVFFSSQFFSDHSTVATDSSFASSRTNPYSGKYFTRVYDARLDAASTVAWYLAGPRDKTVVVFFLQGSKKPYLEQRAGWRVDGTEMKVRIDVVAKAVDWKALYKNYGS